MLDTLRDLIDSTPAENNPSQINSIGAVGGVIFSVLFGVTFSISLIMLAFGALRYVVSSGDPKLIEKAYHTMFWSFLAALFSLMAIAIKNAITHAFGITDPSILTGPTNF